MPMPHDLHPLCECPICLDSRSGRAAALAKSAGAPSVTFKHVGSFLLAAQPMLVEIGEFLDASLEQNADQRATLAWDFSDGSRTIAKIVVSRTGTASAVAKSTDGDPVVGWRERLQEGLRGMLSDVRTLGIEDVAAKFAALTEAFRHDLVQARRDEVTSFGGKVDVGAAFTAEQLAAQHADAVAKAGAAAANAAKVAQLAKQAPRRAPFVWPTDLAKEARDEGADRLLKTADELRIRDLGEQVRHDQRRERILKAVDRELAHLSEEDRRNALRPSRELGFRVLEQAVQHDQRRHELIEKHRGAR